MKTSHWTPLALTALVLITAHYQARAQTVSIIYKFGTNSGDPTNPSYEGTIAQGRDGTLYSTAPSGGSQTWGAIFQVSPSGTLFVPYSFDRTNGSGPQGGLTLGRDGNFYGTTQGGGSSQMGTVFKTTPTGTVTVLHNFSGGSDGSGPYAAPIQGSDGNFYGTTDFGGATSQGTFYKITSSGAYTMLYAFDGTHGSNPVGQLVQGSDGNFYGTTELGGTNSNGVVYKITSSGKITVIYNFDGSIHGGLPVSPLVQGNDGNFYGTTLSYGTGTGGVIFKITAAGHLTVLHNLNGSTDGARPFGGLVQATDGKFYGTTTSGGSTGGGTIYKITPAGAFSVLYNFDGATAAGPQVTLLQHTNGLLYGDTATGGPQSKGAFYSLSLGLGPFVKLMSTSGRVGASVEVLGQGFTGTTSVSFNGTPAPFSVLSDTYLTSTIPNGATTGFVTVTTPGGALVSNQKFRVIPQIKSFSPTSGPVGTLVTIEGVSLTQPTAVAFGGVKATTFTGISDTQVTANVPTGAVTGKITIVTPGGTATSATAFTVTP
jgi:uncharacterized repeat protein (TIGR03803 family)